MRIILSASYLLLYVATGLAAETKLTVPIDYHLLRSVLISQLYTGEGGSARIWKDGKDCSFLDLADPNINAENSQVKIENKVHARFGLQMGGKCLPLTEWRGILQTFQQPTLDATGSVLSFPVTQATAKDLNGQQLNIKQLQDLLTKTVQPKLAALKIDLNQSRGDIIKTLLPFVSADDGETLNDTVNSLRFKRVKVGEKALQVDIGFSGLPQKKTAIQPEVAFNPDELKQWRNIWHDLEQSLENDLNRAPLDQHSDADKAVLREVLQEADAAFAAGLTDDISDGNDPVREFFNSSWDKMAPLLRNASTQFPGAEGLRYLTLISATDIIYQVEAITAPLGLEISANGLRKLARVYISNQATGKKLN